MERFINVVCSFFRKIFSKTSSSTTPPMVNVRSDGITYQPEKKEESLKIIYDFFPFAFGSPCSIDKEEYKIRDENFYYFTVNRENLSIRFNISNGYFIISNRKAKDSIIIRINKEYILDMYWDSELLIIILEKDLIEEIQEIVIDEGVIPENIKQWRGFLT